MNGTDSIDSSVARERDGANSRPQWSLATNFWVASAIVLLTTALVLIVLKKPVWVELEVAVSVIGLAMFLFYFFILYRGVRFKTAESLAVKIAPFTSQYLEPDLSGFGRFASEGLKEGPLGFLFGLLLDVLVCIILTILLALLLWLIGNIFFVGIAVLAIPLFYIFKRSVLFVVRHSEKCHRNLTASARYAASYALVKSAILYLIVYLAHLGSDILKPILGQG